MITLDHKKEFADLYPTSCKSPVIIDVPQMNYLMIDGEGTPADEDFQKAVKTLYITAYVLKFMIYEERKINYKVMPLEVKWTLDRKNKEFSWTMMMQPDFISMEDYLSVLEEARAKHKDYLFDRLRFDVFSKGRYIQMLHKGPYHQMNGTLQAMQEYAGKQNLVCENDTHDIYLNDSRKTKPENLKTIMRIKVKG